MQDPSSIPDFDKAPLDELIEVGGPDLIRELVELFFTETPGLIGQLERAITSEDWESMGRAAHTLKSSSYYLGALLLSDIGRVIEATATSGSPEAAKNFIGQSQQAFDSAKNKLVAFVQTLPA
ncbi:MAG: HPt (histidine-containing phosphotransfer) domain-containing protein [Bacteroidia bacterium]|jgi:HPt (histidine-containing phosphotransfer) domain-containing protein